MRSILCRFLLLASTVWIALSSSAQTVNVTYTFQDYGQTPQSVKSITLTPLAPFGDYNGAILSSVPIKRVTDTSGSYTFTNILSGHAYRVELSTPYGVTTRTNGYPTGLSGNVNSTPYLGDLLGQTFSYRYIGTNFPGAAGQVFTTDGTNFYWAASSASGGGAVIPGTANTVVTNGATYQVNVVSNLFDLAGDAQAKAQSATNILGPGLFPNSRSNQFALDIEAMAANAIVAATNSLANTNRVYALRRAPVFNRPNLGVMSTNSAGVIVKSSGAGPTTYKSQYLAITNASNLQFRFDNASGETPGDNAITIKAAFNDSVASYPILFAGGRTVTIQPGQSVLSDVLPVSVGSQLNYYVQTMVQAPPGGTWILGLMQTSTTGLEGLTNADQVDLLTTSWVGGTNVSYTPSLVYGDVPMSMPTVAYLGDSVGQGYGPPLGQYDESFLNAAFGVFPAYGSLMSHIQLCTSGESRFHWVHQPSLVTKRKLMMQTANFVIDQLGINDSVGGVSLAGMESDATNFWNFLAAQGIKVFATTLTPYNGNNYETNRVNYNNWLRSNTPAVLSGYFEIADAVETARNSGGWKGGYTVDGLHPFGTNAILAMAATINPALFVNPNSRTASEPIAGLSQGANFVGTHTGDGNALTNVPETAFAFTDISAANVSTTKHGLTPKLDNVVTHFLNGQGGFTTPAGSGGSPTFDATQFGGPVGGTNILSGASFTNIQMHGVSYFTNASTGSYISFTQGGFIWSNGVSRSWGIVTNDSLTMSNFLSGKVTSITNGSIALNGTGFAGLGTGLTNALGSVYAPTVGPTFTSGVSLSGGLLADALQASGNVTTTSGQFAGNAGGVTNIAFPINGAESANNLGTAARYFSPSGTVASTTESNASGPSGAHASYLTNFYIRYSIIGASTNYTALWVTNGVDSNLSISINGAGALATGNNTSIGVPIPAGQTFSLKILGNNPSIGTPMCTWSVERVNVN